jgi:hypothetical protein
LPWKSSLSWFLGPFWQIYGRASFSLGDSTGNQKFVVATLIG